MVTVDRLTCKKLTSIIAKELRIDVAFPCFSVEEQTGATACCVVHKHWISTLKQARLGDKIRLNKYSTTTRPENNNSEQLSEDRQAPTTNILVSVLLKRISRDNKRRPQLYKKESSPTNGIEQKILADSIKSNNCDENELPLRTFIKEQLEENPGPNFIELVSKYEKYSPVLLDNYIPSSGEGDNGDESSELIRQKLFVDKFLETLYPHCAYFRILSSTSSSSTSDNNVNNNNDNLCLELITESNHNNNNNEILSTNPNLIDIFAVLESERAYYFMAPYRGTTLQDLLNFSSGVLKSNVKKSFVVYQLLRGVQELHEQGLVHGNLKLSNIFVDENLWINLTGFECCAPEPDKSSSLEQSNTESDTINDKMPRGRRIGDPNFHPIFPWITDFTGSTPSQNWRDFTKTKFRLNKGDEQLDFTFDGPVPHHITDILSDITYYVYLARKTPIPVLCQYVRTKYEPNEYPSSLQRLFEWTPDECIPEFYTDDSIFTSMHPDMPDLQLPAWAPTPQEFIRIHSAALESDYVSSQLHHWIDLTFGCKLSGLDAVEAKNVALPLLDGQDSFMKHGITQLFSDLHPQRSINWNQSQREFDSHKSVTTSVLDKYNKLNSKRRIALTEKSRAPQIPEKISDPLTFDIPAAEKILAKPPGTHPRSKKQTPPVRPLSLYDLGNSNYIRERELSTASMTDSKDPLARIESLALLLNLIPIQLPDEMNDGIFIEQLLNYEQAHLFAVKYQHRISLQNQSFPNDSTNNNSKVTETTIQSTQSFAYGRAWDAYCLGKIIEKIYAENKKSALHELAFSHLSNIDSEIKKDYEVPLAIKGVIDSLSSPDWTKRPTIEAILYTSTPVTTLRDHNTTLPIPSYIPEVYNFLTGFHAVNWKDRLKLVDESLDKLCNLNDEAFNMILPSLVHLFSHEPIRIQALRLFPKLGHRLGEEETKNHLLKPIVSLFESSHPSIPKILFESYIIEQFLRCFGITNFLQQLFPLYLEALTIDERIHATISPQEEEGVGKYFPNYTSSPVSLKSSFDFNNRIIPSVTQLANSAFVDICFLIGPILTSKYVMKQIYKLLLKEYSSLHLLIQSLSTIGSQFGETFTYLQYAQAISVIQANSTPSNSKNTIIISNQLALLEKLTPQLSSSKIFTEFESGFADALNKILGWNETSAAKSPAVTTQNIKNKLSMHLKTMNYLLHVTNNVSKDDWERYIAPILQKYFASFGMSPENPSHNTETNGISALEEERDRQMVYAYSQFCIIVGQETMRRIIPISDAIESVMYDQFASNDTLPLRDASPLSIEIQINGRSPDNSQSPTSSGGGKEHFSNKDELNGDETTKISSKKNIKDSNSWTSGSHAHRARSLFTNENDRKSPESTNGKRTQKGMSFGSVANLSTPSSLDKNWNRYLSTNSEEMSNSLQFTFNDLKLRTYLGHNSAIRGIGINENSRIIASGSRDRTVKIWSLDIHHGVENSANEPYSECLMTYNGHRKTGVGDVYFVGGGGSLGLHDVVASCDGLIHLWVPESGQIIHQFSNNRTLFISIRPIFRSRYLLGGLSDNTLTFLDTINHTSLHTWKCSTGFTGTIRAISVNTSETLIAVGFTSGIISLVDTRTGMMIGSWKAGDTDIIHLKFYSSNYLISCAPADHVICIWDTDTMSLIKTIRVNSDIVALNMYKDNLITINNTNTISFTPLNENLQAYSSKFRSSTIKSSITSLGILPINQLLVLGCVEGDLFLSGIRVTLLNTEEEIAFRKFFADE
ncbi:6116_t:CDS:10 [Ambispora gerdemannii]|uniref:6116_t:CDS:1 n=1 Tax=Ambispora gerdemannii TaxID=144530 RepID=A0A9N8W7C9_9GLOM|nr:6116_t:CDS:10 [Ambispora gerdemannii]